MDGVNRAERRRGLKERLGLKGMGCCGAIMTVRGENEEEGPEREENCELIDVGQTPPANTPAHGCGVGQAPTASGMNLAAALAAERHYRMFQDSDGSASPVGPTSNRVSSATGGGTAPGTPLRMSLMKLLEETDGTGDDAEGRTAEKEERGGVLGGDSACCVCMGRKKGAAFIPCGHTFCRVCSRELWLNRGSCPLCNRLILEILDLF